MMWILLAAHAQECSIRTAVGGFPLGVVPLDASSTVVLESACPMEGGVTVFAGEEQVHQESLIPVRDGDFWFFQFWADRAPTQSDLRFELEVTRHGDPLRYVAGWYLVDADLEAEMVGQPELGNVRIERRGGTQVFTADVLPATTAAEALFLWRVDGVLEEATVSTRPRPELILSHSSGEVCIEVEEIGVDGSRAVSEPHCVEAARTGCGCSSLHRSLVGIGLRR